MLHRSLLACTSFLALTVIAGAETPALPFTVSQETTAIASPLRPNGAPDYVKAINDFCAQGVTPANNGYVVWLESVVGTDLNVMATSSHDRVLAMAGAADPAPGTVLWLESAQYLQSVEKMARNRAGNEGSRRNAELQACMEKLWAEDEYPHTAAYLKAMAVPLDHVAQAAACEKWWSPYVVGSHGDDLMDVLLPSLGRERSVVYALCARATLRAKAGDFEGFLNDIVTVRRLARHVATGVSLIERLVAAALETAGCNALGTVAGSGIFTADQCQKLKSAMDALSPMPTLVDSLDVMERWSQLEFVQQVALDDETFLTESGLAALAHSVDRNAVDWNMVLRHVNALMDQEVAIFHNPALPDRRDAILVFDKEREDRAARAATKPAPEPEQGGTESDAAFAQRVSVEANFKILQPLSAGESREAYSGRVADAIAGRLWPSLGKADQITSAALFRGEAARVVIAAAVYKAATNKWPEKLADLVPRYLKEVPHDPYDPGTEVHLLVGEKGVRVYSYGSNGIDDGGLDNAKVHADDIGSGVIDSEVP